MYIKKIFYIKKKNCFFVHFRWNYYFLDNDSPADCTSLHNNNCGLTSGLYRIKLPFLGHVTAFCDMDTDGGGWTVQTVYYHYYYHYY